MLDILPGEVLDATLLALPPDVGAILAVASTCRSLRFAIRQSRQLWRSLAVMLVRRGRTTAWPPEHPNHPSFGQVATRTSVLHFRLAWHVQRACPAS